MLTSPYMVPQNCIKGERARPVQRRRSTKMLLRAALRSSSLAGAPARRAPAAALQPSHRDPIPPPIPQFKIQSRHFLDLHKMGNKEAIEKERARISDELSRGYFADISEIRQNGGKIAMADKIIIPSSSAVKFPDLEVSFSDGRCLKLPIALNPGQSSTDTNDLTKPSASLLCLSFRASSQTMTESWIVPFLKAFNTSGEIQVYEVSFVDSWLLSTGPFRRLFLKMMKKSDNPRKHIAYAFGDHYDFRKKLQILNLLTGYIFLLDRLGRIRWHGFGHATDEEISSLLSCTSLVLDEK